MKGDKDKTIDDLRTKAEQLQAEKDAAEAATAEAAKAKDQAETAKTAAVAELSQAHRAEVAEIRAKLDARTDDLMQARQQAGDTQILLQKEQARSADLERQLKTALAELEALRVDK